MDLIIAEISVCKPTYSIEVRQATDALRNTLLSQFTTVNREFGRTRRIANHELEMHSMASGMALILAEPFRKCD